MQTVLESLDIKESPIAIAIAPWLVRTMNRMTLLVGIIGTDGIVLAADTKSIRPSNDGRQVCGSGDVYKIYELAPKCGVAVAFAGDWVANAVASEIRASITEGRFQFEDVRASLVEAADQRVHLVGPIMDELNRCLMVAIYAPDVSDPQLWVVEIRPKQKGCTAIQEKRIAIEGATANTATFFKRYFQRGKSVQQLKLLAAHIILMGNEADNAIEGLCMAVCDRHGFRYLAEAEMDELEKQSRRIDELIGERLSS